MPHIAHDRLSTLIHRDVLNCDLLLASHSVPFKRLYLRRERPGELVENSSTDPGELTLARIARWRRPGAISRKVRVACRQHRSAASTGQ
jgi:hypothetical protein